VKDKKLSGISGTYDVTFGSLDPNITTDDGFNTDCSLHSAVALKFSPELKKTAFWVMGQGYIFNSDDCEKNKNCTTDEKMSNSFSFIRK
jgi:hypothetical protein